jgi:hypothetical protein
MLVQSLDGLCIVAPVGCRSLLSSDRLDQVDQIERVLDLVETDD